MDKEDVMRIHTYTYTYYTHTQWTVSHEKEWNITICSNMDMSRDYHTKWSKSEENDKYPMIHLYVESKKKKLIEINLCTK